MKSKLLFIGLLSASVVLSGCSLIKSESVRQNKTTTTETKNSKDKVYGLNEEWIVTGQ